MYDHDFDDNSVCKKCGFDGAEHAWLRWIMRSEMAQFEEPGVVRAEVDARYPPVPCKS